MDEEARKRIHAVTELFLSAQRKGHVKKRYLGMSAEQFQEELIEALYRKREEKISQHDGMT
jgi:hypothetical protein